MLHKVIDWIGYKLHLKKYTMDDVACDLAGIIIAVCMASLAERILADAYGELPWYGRLWWRLTDTLFQARIIFIGY